MLEGHDAGGVAARWMVGVVVKGRIALDWRVACLRLGDGVEVVSRSCLDAQVCKAQLNSCR